MTIVKTQDKPLNLSITIEEKVQKKNEVEVNPSGRIVIGKDSLLSSSPKETKKDINVYTITVTANIKSYSSIKEKKESLKELKISIRKIWINKLLNTGEPEKQINLSGENIVTMKPLLINIIKNIILEYKSSYEFYKRLREDVDFFVKIDSKENIKLTDTVKLFLENQKEENMDFPEI